MTTTHDGGNEQMKEQNDDPSRVDRQGHLDRPSASTGSTAAGALPDSTGKQRLLTIPLGRILAVFIEQSTAGNRIVSIAPHYNAVAMLIGYLVVVDPKPAGSPKCPSCGEFRLCAAGCDD